MLFELPKQLSDLREGADENHMYMLQIDEQWEGYYML